MTSQHKISGTYNGGSGYYIARVATLKRDRQQIFTSAGSELSIDAWCRRQSTVDGKFESEFKNFRVKRTGRFRLSRFAKDLSQWLDSQETPLDARVDALLLVTTCYKSSRCFNLLKRLTLTLEIGVTALEETEETGDERECTVCLEGFSVGPHSRAVEIPCSHAFHGHCIAGWLKKQSTCPLCRSELKTHQIEDIRTSTARI